MSQIKRRNFLTAFTSGLLGLGLAKNIEAGKKHPTSFQGETPQPKIKKYNPLGNTGLKISDVSCGAISLFEPNVLRYAYDCGVTYFDTAESYSRMKGEAYVGQALKGVREKVCILTKHAYDFRKPIDKAAIFQRFDASLKRLQTDYLDIAFVHNVDDVSPLVQNEDLLSAYSQLKKEGKVRFTGFSTHNPRLTLKQALETDYAQVVLFIYNHLEGKEIAPLIKAARQKGIGTIAMKIFAGGAQGNLKSLVTQGVSYPQAAIRWVLSNPDIDACIPTMSSYSHVEEYVAASGMPLERSDLKLIAGYQRQVSQTYCRVSCRDCLATCPKNVAINDVLRYAMYYENYRMEKMAMDCYAELDGGQKPQDCALCSGYCQNACPFGLKVRERLMRAHEILASG